MFWRRKRLLTGIVFLTMAVAAIGLGALTPLYTAQTDLIVESRERMIADLKAVLGDVSPDKEGILSEIQVIGSRRIAERVMDRLKLYDDPEFNTPGLLTALRKKIAAYLPSRGPDRPKLSEEERLKHERDKVVDAFLDRLEVSVIGQSRVIMVHFTSEDPEKAARISDAIADTYIGEQLEAKFEATQRANEWLAGKLQDLRKQVVTSEGAVEAYRRRAGLLQSQQPGKEGTLISQQVTDLNTQLVIARTDRAAAEARLSQVRQMIRAAGNAQAAADVLGSPTIQDLSRQETEIKRTIADLSQELGNRHPRLISARAELNDVQTKLANEVNKVVQKMENEAATARAREEALQRSAKQLEGQLGQANEAEVQLRALQRKSEANKTLLEQFLSRSEEITAQSDLMAQQTNTRILSRAVAPEVPSEPKWLQALALIFIAASVLAAVVVMLVENMDRGFRSGEQIEASTGARPLGLVPILKGRRRGGPPAYIVRNPSSLFGESIRSVYTSILISHAKPAPRTVLITSSQPNEGKTTLAACLARMCAISGKSVVLLDSELRNPSVHRALGIPQSPGLAEFYRGEASAAGIQHRDAATGAIAIPSGRLGLGADPIKTLASKEVRQLIADLTFQFDLVLIDSAPLMAVSDARLLAPEMDATVFVVRWGKTNREVARKGLKELLESGATVGGVVLSMVDADKHAQSSFGNSGYYHKSVRSYYAS